MVCPTQHADLNVFPEVLPLIDKVEIHDFVSCRQEFRRRSYDGKGFESAVPRLMQGPATRYLEIMQWKVPQGVQVDLIYICDLLICVPTDDFVDQKALRECNSDEKISEKKESLLKRITKLFIKEVEPVERLEEDKTSVTEPLYRTAKLVSLFQVATPTESTNDREEARTAFQSRPSRRCVGQQRLGCCWSA